MAFFKRTVTQAETLVHH